MRGTVRNPMPRVEVVDKARDLTAPMLGATTAQALITTLLAIESVKDVRTLRPLIQKASGPTGVERRSRYRPGD